MPIQFSISAKPLFQTTTSLCLRSGHDWSLPVMRGGGLVQVTRTCWRCGQVDERVESEYEAETQASFP
ncbi:MAG: hypothetical protein WCZ69_02645 [Candidatus Paceibacterota bacterium]